jgi:hypothetical protein
MARNSARRPWPRVRKLALGVAVVIAGLFLLKPHTPRFGADKFERLRLGMTEDEVVAILGCPPGDYRPAIWRKPTWYVHHRDIVGSLEIQRGRSTEALGELERQDVREWVKAGEPIPPPPARVRKMRWWARGNGIEAAVDAQGQVIHLSLWTLWPPRPPPIYEVPTLIRWWVGR